MPYNHPAMFFRKSVYDQYGLYDVSYKYAMDYELIIRFENSIRNFSEKGKYLHGEPVAVMNAGGASWQHELKSIKECRAALKKNGLWNFNAKKSYYLRIFRTRLKEYLSKLNLNAIIKLWRKAKWKS
jgi:hypothetical protein